MAIDDVLNTAALVFTLRASVHDSSVAKSVRLFCGNMRTVYWTMRLKNFSALASGRALITYKPSCAQGPKNSEHNLVARG